MLLGCSKQQQVADDTKWGEPVGIELSGEDMVAAVAVEAGHNLDAAAVPELAGAMANVTKACPSIKSIGSSALTIKMSVKDGAIVSPPDPKGDALGQCVAGALDGKPATKLGNGKLMIQFAGKEKK
jgi:hypothetical protein